MPAALVCGSAASCRRHLTFLEQSGARVEQINDEYVVMGHCQLCVLRIQSLKVLYSTVLDLYGVVTE